MNNAPAAGAANVNDGTAVVSELGARGLLFLSDPKRKNAIEVLTGQFPRGSWWSHPDAHAIYATLQGLEQHPDVLFAKLLSGKVTLVHRTLWPALLAVVTAREPWQVSDLPPTSAEWLASFDEAVATGAEPPPAGRTVTKEIEARLLARGESVHTTAGRHETRLEAWTTWAARVGCAWPPGNQAPAPTAAEGKAALAAAAAALGPPPPELPW